MLYFHGERYHGIFLPRFLCSGGFRNWLSRSDIFRFLIPDFRWLAAKKLTLLTKIRSTRLADLLLLRFHLPTQLLHFCCTLCANLFCWLQCLRPKLVCVCSCLSNACSMLDYILFLLLSYCTDRVKFFIQYDKLFCHKPS